MKRALLSLAIALIAAARARADSADLKIYQFQPPAVEHAGETFYGNIFILNLGPDAARNVVVTQKVDGWPEAQIPCPEGRCAVGDVKPIDGFPLVPRIAQALPLRDFTFTMTVTVSSDTPDPNPENNSVTRSIHVSMAPFLRVWPTFPLLVDPGAAFDATLGISNEGREYAVAHDVVVTLDLPDGVGVTSIPDDCTVAGSKIDCRLDTLPARSFFDSPVFKLRLTAPPRNEGGTLLFHASAIAREPNYDGSRAESTATTLMVRTFFVTTTADSGNGSLRAAVEEANALCNSGPPCNVQFNIAEPSPNRWKTIRLQTPLPALRAYALRIDGSTQAAFSGVANPDGPPIEIAGAGTMEGDGLLAHCYVEIANLAINGFRGNGISLTPSPGACACRSGCFQFDSRAFIHHNFIGTDPTGSLAVPNDRGIGVAEPVVLNRLATIAHNVISGNAKSGIFVLGGDLEVTSNRIGVKAHAEQPLPNGASGMYFHGTTGRINVTTNTIAFNRQMGVAIHPQARYVYLDGNRIWGNGGQAVDDGLDGPSATTADVGTPVITSAVFDPVKGQTRVRGTAGGYQTPIQVFASDTRGAPGSGDAQRLLGQTFSFVTFPEFPFEFVFDGDLRGQWITAMSSRNFYHPAADVFSLNRSGELSAAVQVQ